MLSTLISPADLNARIGLVLPIDCRFDLAQPGAGRIAYSAGHIPGAIYAHLDEDLSGPITPRSGRHPLPDPAVLAKTFGRWGIDNATQVIAYDADSGMFASRLWWLLRWLGHKRVAVLDGGLKGWCAAGHAVATDSPRSKPTYFVGHAHPEMVVTTDEVALLVKQSSSCVLDARAPERFRGEIEPIDTVAGHIPGARNHPFAWSMGDGRLLPAAELAKKLAASLDGVAPDRSVMMCGSGVTACHNLLAMEVAGMPGAKLYAGSWSEWIRDPSRPVATGPA